MPTNVNIPDPPKRLLKAKQELTKKRIRAAWRYYNAWCRHLTKAPKVSTIPELEAWMAKVIGYSNSNSVNNVLHCNGNFDDRRLGILESKLAQRQQEGDSRVRLNVFRAENNLWYTQYYQAMVTNAAKTNRNVKKGESPRRKKDPRRIVRLRKRQKTVVILAPGRLGLVKAKVKTVTVARGGKQVVVELQYT